MKLISSAVFTTLAVLSFNCNVFAMKEQHAPFMDDIQMAAFTSDCNKEPRARHMDMRAPRLPEEASHSSNICARCFYGILDRLTEAGCCSEDARECFCHSLKLLAGCGCCTVSLVGMFASFIDCLEIPGAHIDSIRISCHGPDLAVCTLCAATSGVYTAYQFCKLCLLQRDEEDQTILHLAAQVETIIQDNARREPGELH